jgi:ribonuclease BN (tRNA processing enzyme)
MAAYLLEAPTFTMMLDCGPTALLSMKRNGISPEPVDAVILSHLHGDHFAGLPFLFLEYRFERRRTRPLIIAGPPGTPERVHEVFRTMYRELAAEPMPFPIEFVELLPEVPARVGEARVFPFRVPHQEHEISLGVRVQLGGSTVLYSGDSGWTEAFVEHSRGTDLFICECCYFETSASFHLDYPRIAANRNRLSCKQLILTHIGREVLARLSEVREQIADDGLVVEVGSQRFATSGPTRVGSMGSAVADPASPRRTPRSRGER